MTQYLIMQCGPTGIAGRFYPKDSCCFTVWRRTACKSFRALCSSTSAFLASHLSSIAFPWGSCTSAGRRFCFHFPA